MELVIRGQIAAIKKSEYQGVVNRKLQFLSHSDNGIELIDVKVEEEFFDEKLKKGVDIICPIKISAMEGKVFYKAISPIKFK